MFLETKKGKKAHPDSDWVLSWHPPAFWHIKTDVSGDIAAGEEWRHFWLERGKKGNVRRKRNSNSNRNDNKATKSAYAQMPYMKMWMVARQWAFGRGNHFPKLVGWPSTSRVVQNQEFLPTHFAARCPGSSSPRRYAVSLLT